MRKNKAFTLIACVLFTATLSSCFFYETDFNWGSNTTSNNTNSASTSAVAEYNTPSYTSSFTKDNMNIDNIGKSLGYRYMPRTGDSKILVIPIQTKDDRFSSNYKTRLQAAFFGDDTSTGWESVSSYYYKSSYGQLNITGEVTDALTFNYTTAELEQMADESSGNLTDSILDSALDALNENGSVDLSEYDTDDDGYIDAVWMVYAADYDSSSSLLWAYTTWSSVTTSYDSVKASCYAWASISFLDDGGYTLPDAHTFIHETGHILGLDDYYSYDYTSSGSNPCYDTPTGGVDMMDFNIGDHNAFSKYLLGWVTPTVLTEEYLESINYTLTLSPMSTSGQAYILPVYDDGQLAYNDTPFDEYLILEFYTPTNLNYKDSQGTGYAGRLATYSVPGVVLYHVNATIGKIVATSSTTIAWDGCAYDMLPDHDTDRGWMNYNYIYTFLYSNTYSYSYDQTLGDANLDYYRGRLISLLPATGKRINGSRTGYANNRSLYRSGTSFNSNTYAKFAFDDGNVPSHGFTVTKVSSEECTISFTDF